MSRDLHASLFLFSKASSITKWGFRAETMHRDLQNGHKLALVRGFSTTSSRSWRSASPYEILGVTRSATANEIKMAYFKAAKAAHPDLNREPDSNEKFQRIAAAYEILKDDSRRRQYDSSESYGGGWGSGSGSSATQGGRRSGSEGRQQNTQWQRHQQQWHTQWEQQYQGRQGNQNQGFAAADVLFRSVMRDGAVIKEALLHYSEDLTEELGYGLECLGRGDYANAWSVVRANRGILFLIVPVALFLRAPALVSMVVGVGGRAVLQILFLSGQLGVAAEWIWRRVVALAADRVRRRA
jgi:hypothetical protein